MDKILLVDFLNFVFKGKITFGAPKLHFLHTGNLECDKCHYNISWTEDTSYNAEELIEPHCNCKSPWNVEENFCYGQKYNLIYNFFRNLRALVEQFEPNKIFFVLEGHPKFRYDLYADYKANRIIKTGSKQEEKDKILQDADEIVKLLAHLPVMCCRHPDYEADDTISSLSANMKDEEVIVVSNDSDHIQLLQKGYQNIKVYNSHKKEFQEAPGYPYTVWKSLNGDKSDHLPALLKPKKALATVNDPQLFEKFLSIEENRANFSINKKLIDFADVPIEEVSFAEGQSNFEILKKEFEKMKFKSLIEENYWEKFKKTFEGVSI